VRKFAVSKCGLRKGSIALDAARTAVRLGAQEVYIVYRRTEKEMPARREEIEHAEEEGVKFALLTNPVKFHGDENGNMNSMICIKYELGETDESGRRRPVAIKRSEYEMKIDNVITALGQGPNPLIGTATKRLELNKWGNIVTDEETGETSKPGVFADGDIVTGAATVILAMVQGEKRQRLLMST